MVQEQETREAFLERKRKEREAYAAGIPEPPARKEPMSVTGFAENLLDQTFEIAKGIVMAFPAAIKAGADILGDPKGVATLLADPKHLVSSFRDTGRAFGKAMVSDYQEYGAGVLYRKPLTPVLDAMTLLTFGGASAARLGRAAGGLSKAERALTGITTVSKADKLVDIGNAMSRIPNRIGQAISQAPLRAVGINPESRRFWLVGRREEIGEAERLMALAEQKLAKNVDTFTAAEKELLVEYLQTGGERARLAANPRVQEAYENVQKWLVIEREKELLARNLLTREEMDTAVAKKYADARGVPLDEARRQIEALEVKPLYAPAVREGKGLVLQDALSMPTVIRKGKVPFLEPFVTAAGATRDPSVIIRTAIRDFYLTRAHLRMIDRVVQSPYAQAARRGEAALSEIIPTQGIFQRYFKDRARAGSVEIAAARRAQGAEAVGRTLAENPEARAALARRVNITIADPTLQNIIRREFTQLGGEPGWFVKAYDRITSLFKRSATIYNPRWTTGNVVGDALLATLAGADWAVAREMLLSKKLPSEILASGLLLTEIGRLASFESKLSTVARAADEAGRAAIFFKAVISKIKGVLVEYGASEETLRRVASEVALAPRELSNIIIELQNLGEIAARQTGAVVKLDRQIASLERKVAKAAKESEVALAKGISRTERLQEQSRLEAALRTLKARRDYAVADIRQGFVRQGALEERIPGLRERAVIAEEAVDRANAFLGEYLALGPIERGVFRRIVPFYAWTKAMSKLAFMLPFIAPARTFFWHRYSQAMMEMMGDPELPEYMAPFAPVFLRSNGETVWASMLGLSPFGALRKTKIGGVPIPQLFAFWENNPWISVGYRMIGGRDKFHTGSVPYGEPVVAINDGEVYQFNEDGKLERIVAQAPLVKSFAYLFPPVQMIDQLISNYDVRRGPALNADGTFRYPIELWQRLASLTGVKTKIASRDDLIRWERLKVRQVIREAKRAYRRATPEQQEYIRGLIEDYSRGAYRRIAAQ